MKEHEHLMYQVIGKISDTAAPIVFKGALITNLILKENGYTLSERSTVDIDANWVGEPPSMSELVNVFNRSLEAFESAYYAVAKREYSPGKSAGIWILSKGTGDRLFEIDISISPVIGSKTYYYGEAAICGVVPDAVLCDKISVLSGDKIFRRVKDIYDVYALACCVEVHTTSIYSALEKAGRVLDDFHAFIHRRQDLEHAYTRLKGIVGKPEFCEVYPYLEAFLTPFILQDRSPRVWSGKRGYWHDMNERLDIKHSRNHEREEDGWER